MEGNVVSVDQLSSVATSMKTYIDAKDKKNSDSIDGVKATAEGAAEAAETAQTAAEAAQTSANNAKTAADNAQAAVEAETAAREAAITAAKADVKSEIEEKLPSEATAAEIKSITDLFSTEG